MPTTATVTNRVLLPDGITPVDDLVITAQIYPNQVVYRQDGVELFPVELVNGNTDGSWSMSLERTDLLTPANMVYQITESSDSQGIRRVSYIYVPLGGGRLENLLTQPPTVPPQAVVAGPPGPANTGFSFSQSVASAMWRIVHNLGLFPSVTVTDSTGDQVEGDVQCPDVNTVLVLFAIPVSGTAHLI